MRWTRDQKPRGRPAHLSSRLDSNERSLAVLLRTPHRYQPGISQAIGERIGKVIEVSCIEQIPRSWQPDIESERPRSDNPGLGEKFIRVIQVRLQSDLIGIISLVPRRQSRRDPQLICGTVRPSVPIHRTKIMLDTDRTPP
jgi:hypothetical protein